MSWRDEKEATRGGPTTFSLWRERSPFGWGLGPNDLVRRMMRCGAVFRLALHARVGRSFAFAFVFAVRQAGRARWALLSMGPALDGPPCVQSGRAIANETGASAPGDRQADGGRVLRALPSCWSA